MKVVPAVERRRPTGAGGKDPEVDPRIEARRRAIRAQRQARRRRALLVVSLLVVVTAAAYGATRSRLLDVDDILVAGAVHTPPEQVREQSGIRVGDPLVEVDEDRAAAAVRALPWVLDADVDTAWTGSVEVRVTERTPRIVVDGGDGRWALADGDRRVLALVPAAPDDLLVVRGPALVEPGRSLAPEAGAALAVAAVLPPGVRSRVVALQLTGAEVELELRPAGRVRLGPVERLDEKITAVRTVFGQVDLDGLCALDVRVPDAPVLTRQKPCA